MNEYSLIWYITAAFWFSGMAAFLYALGGRSKKWQRRFLAPVFITGGLSIIAYMKACFSPYLLISYPFLCISWCLGYGSDDTFVKVVKRTVVALVIMVLSGVFAWQYESWGIFYVHLVMLGLTVFLGVKGVIKAAVEEFIICVFQTLPLFLYLFK